MKEFNPARDRCEKCKYWASSTGEFGDCRRKSPRSTREGAVWPETHYSKWCGDFEVSFSSAEARSESSLRSLSDMPSLSAVEAKYRHDGIVAKV